jgi:hypothetical protein
MKPLTQLDDGTLLIKTFQAITEAIKHRDAFGQLSKTNGLGERQSSVVLRVRTAGPAFLNDPKTGSHVTTPHSQAEPGISHEQHWPSAAAALAVGAAFFSLWFWLLPQWLGFQTEMAGRAYWRWLAAVPSILGFAVALRYVWNFG